MAEYRGVGNVAREVAKEWRGVGNVAREVSKAWRGVNNVAREYLASGTPVNTLAVGSSVYMNINGVRTEFIVIHQGVPSSLYDSSCNGTWLLTKNIYEKRQWHNAQKNDYENSTIHTYLNGTFYSLFDGDIQSVIKQVKIPYYKGVGTNESLLSGTYGLPTKVFLLSVPEVGGTITEAGACTSYFKGTAAGADSRRFAYYNGENVSWWLRDPTSSVATQTFHVWNNDGAIRQSSSNVATYGVRPALILSSDAKFDGSFNVMA